MRWRAGTVEADAVAQRVHAWIAHAEHAQTWRLRHALFRGGWFDPLREPDGPPDGRVCPKVSTGRHDDVQHPAPFLAARRAGRFS